jgi:hypothetical protein
VRLSRQPSAGTVIGPRSAAGRGTTGSRSRRPCSLDPVLCGRKSWYWPAACAAAITWLTAASTSGALRRVWSQVRRLAAQAGRDEALRGREHLRLGAAEPVDALLGVAHDEHAGRGCRPRPRSH